MDSINHIVLRCSNTTTGTNGMSGMHTSRRHLDEGLSLCIKALSEGRLRAYAMRKGLTFNTSKSE
eukprot:195464-Pelagomonas_calceolata.AAC.1